jgi:hypothetical protein
MAATKKATDAAVTDETEQTGVSATSEEKAENGGNLEATEAKEDVTYTAEEFAKASETVFNKPYSQDIVAAAFRMAGKDSATKAEAAEIVGKFLNKEVKVK